MVDLEEMTKQKAASPQHTRNHQAPWLQRGFVAFLIAYVGLLTWFCCVKVMAFDELLSYYTAHVPSAAQLLALQRAVPVSLDPPLVHLCAFWAMHLGIDPVFAVRLPSLLGSVVMIVCAYLFTRRLAGQATASFTVVGLLLVDQFHMVEGRPYGVLLGLSALALLLWQNVLRQQHRTASLCGLFLTLGAAISSHYFGILVVVPFALAECLRIARRRRLDPALAAVLVASPLFAAGWIPFLAGAHQYKSRYYIKVQWTDLSRTYTAALQKLLHVHTSAAEIALLIAVLAVIACGAWLGYTHNRQADGSPSPGPDPITEWAGVAAFALLPFAGVLLAFAASGAFEVRYIIEFTLGTTLCLAAGLLAVIRGRTFRAALLVAGCVLAVALLGRSIRQDAHDRGSLEQLASATLAAPTLLTDKEEFLWIHAYHGSDAAAANALWVADLNREAAASGSDNIDRTMINLRTRAGLPVLSFADAAPAFTDRHMIVSDRSTPPNWLPSALAASGAKLTLVQTIGQDHVYTVQQAAAN